MADCDGKEPGNVLPFIPRAPAPIRPRSTGDGRVSCLGAGEPTEPWRGEEEWISTLPDPHDTTRTDEPEWLDLRGIELATQALIGSSIRSVSCGKGGL